MQLTNHAIVRMRQMGLSSEKIAEVLDDAEVDYSQEDYGNGRRLAQRGVLAVAYFNRQDGCAVVVTILERKQERWER